MRISDWSSDVCSSDLQRTARRARRRREQGVRTGGRAVLHARERRARSLQPKRKAARRRIGACVRLHAGRSGDRKSVVSGKSGSVRVDLGGRRIIKKKKEEADQI